MDKELHDKYYRIIGQVTALHKMAIHTDYMPCDMTTAALLHTIRGLTERAILSASTYADERTADK